MGKIGILALTALSVLMVGCSQPADEAKGTLQTDPGREYVIVVHGGAGAMSSLKDNPDQESAYYAALDSALMIGDSVLSAGGDGPQAVLAVIHYFEGNPLFNAGIGATVTADGTFELDAAIMEGHDLSAGAVAGVKHVKHPIDAAYAVKEQSPHVMLSGSGAEAFAREKGRSRRKARRTGQSVVSCSIVMGT